MWRGCDVGDLTAHNIRHSRATSGSPTASAAPSFRKRGRSDAFHTRRCTIPSTHLRSKSFLAYTMYYYPHKNKSVEVGIDRYHDYDLDP
ncbi:hypothetical protein Y032_0015g2885 [Ancylostoma ceylanicum]|uniref:Uncharacterized protein n=1 Tax=Ancylostoma ceylanicum TaxID=53326 RepID=A0A016VA26_9BILA|nr:hypothetical protein Y032_0015g2885 [Ancylostoma ceylanicum]